MANSIRYQKGPPPGFTGLITKVILTPLVGTTAGNNTLTGIKLNADYIISIKAFKLTLTEGTPNTYVWAVADVTSEFNITANDTINNTSGTDMTGYLLMVQWYSNALGEQSNAVRN
jgi:hypothetical protein